jgi:hypothetical protein
MSAYNVTRSIALGDNLISLNGDFSRLLRHINRQGIPKGCVLWINPCQAIYTIGMRSAVDIAFIDKDGRVVRIFRNFPPGCFTETAPAAVSVLEFPASTLSDSGTSVGDIIRIDLE